MREEIRKAGPFMHVSQQVGILDQRIHVADLGIQFLGGHRDFAGGWCDEQRSGLKTNSFELSGSGSVRQTVQVEVEHLTGFGKPLRAISFDAQSETILSLHRDECRPRHQMLVNRPERAAAVDPDVRRSKPVSQSRERCDLVGRPGTPREIAYGCLFLASDESTFMTGADLVIDGGYLAQ